MNHIKVFSEFSETNEGLFSKNVKNKEVELIENKISEAAYSIQTFGTLTKQGAFINGAKWVVHNLTDVEINKLRDNTDRDGFSFFGMR